MQKRYLGVDYGRAHVGLAKATTFLAEPLYSVDLDQAKVEIQKLVAQHEIDTIVFGLSEGYIGTETKQFAQSLNLDQVTIEFVDETLSSQEAQALIRHKKQAARQGSDHHYAAAVLLQHYIDLHQTNYV